jgi:hypothetical protein
MLFDNAQINGKLDGIEDVVQLKILFFYLITEGRLVNASIICALQMGLTRT